MGLRAFEPSMATWVWFNIQEQGLCRFWSWFPSNYFKKPVGVPLFEPQPHGFSFFSRLPHRSFCRCGNSQAGRAGGPSLCTACVLSLNVNNMCIYIYIYVDIYLVKISMYIYYRYIERERERDMRPYIYTILFVVLHCSI